MKPAVRFAALVLGAVLLAACVPADSLRKLAASPQALAAQQAREAALGAQVRWTMQARIGVSGENGGSGDLLWKQDGDAYAFSVRGANGRTLRLSGDAQRAVLEGVDAQPDVAADAERLLRERLNVEVPFASLRRWVFGLSASGSPAQWRFDSRDLPAQLVQDGWTIDYLDWFADRVPPLPKRLFATRGKDKVKLSIQSWDLGE